jgi:hypothetical protein
MADLQNQIKSKVTDTTNAAKFQGNELVNAVKDQAKSVISEAKAQAQAAINAVKDLAGAAKAQADEAKAKAKEAADKAKEAADKIKSMAKKGPQLPPVPEFKQKEMPMPKKFEKKEQPIKVEEKPQADTKGSVVSDYKGYKIYEKKLGPFRTLVTYKDDKIFHVGDRTAATSQSAMIDIEKGYIDSNIEKQRYDNQAQAQKEGLTAEQFFSKYPDRKTGAENS